jgi:hypothetical protein
VKVLYLIYFCNKNFGGNLVNREYRGIVIEESLYDNRVINGLDIRKIVITGQDNPQERWHMYEVTVSEDEIMMLANQIREEWYMHFWKDRDIIAIFKDREFRFNYDNRETWGEVLEYGRSQGLPDYQLDFPIGGL